MKNIMFFVLAVIVVILISYASAHYVDYDYKEKISTTKYYPEENFAVTTTRYADYDNEGRYSTYDYRHGYSYRTTKDYWGRHYDEYQDIDEWDDWKEDDWHDWERNYRGEWRDGNRDDWRHGKHSRWEEEGVKGYFYRYNKYSDNYDRVECYRRSPSDKLFYVKCP